MAETYGLRSKRLLTGPEVEDLSNIFDKKYSFGSSPVWYDGDSLEESGWCYTLTSPERASIEDLDILKTRKGLTLLLTQDQAAALAPLILSKKASDLSQYPVDILPDPNSRLGGKN